MLLHRDQWYPAKLKPSTRPRLDQLWIVTFWAEVWCVVVVLLDLVWAAKLRRPGEKCTRSAESIPGLSADIN